MPPARQPTSIHQLKMTLQNIQPPIWRRIQVPNDATLNQLHAMLQIAMGWEDYHLHLFQVGNETFSNDKELGGRSERARLRELALVPGKTFIYEYDFGDGWEHLIEVERVSSPEPGATYPICTAGERACPPEDCGGPRGYGRLLEVLSDPDHPEHEDMQDWLGYELDPEAFNLTYINLQLTKLR